MIYQIYLLMMMVPKRSFRGGGLWRNNFVGDEDSHKLDDSKHVYKRDKELRNKLPAWKLVFLGILLEEWMKYDKEGITITPQVNNKTKSISRE